MRERAGLRVRQPLRALHVRASDQKALDLLATRFATEQVLDELNVKAWGSLAADDGELCSLAAKPNFRVLGKRVGNRMKAVAAAIAALPPADIARLRAGDEVAIDVGEEPVVLSPEDVEVQVEIHADFDVETDGRIVVFLDTEVDDELVAEGLARELAVRVNALRKSRDLAVADRIHLQLWHRGDLLLARALSEHGTSLREETLATQLLIREEPIPGAEPEEWDLGDGRRVTASLRRVPEPV